MNPSTYPRPEPIYNAKRGRDFSAFASALAAFLPARSRALDELLTGATVLEIQHALTVNQLRAEELTLYYIERIRRYDLDKLNAVMALNPAALEIARQLDAERANGTVRGPLHGIPVLIKDNIATGDGLHASAGAWALRNWQPDRDAFLVQQLRAAGAVILGKANLSEWANYMDPTMPNGFSVLGGQTRNPYGPFDALGSSSGSAVAVAANLTVLAVGSETQGSIIMPAGSNSIVGLKPSRGLISGDYIIPLVDWMDVPGPMGRTVTDVAVLLGAMTGVDERDPTTQSAAALAKTDFTQFLSVAAVRGMRLGIVVQDEADVNQQIKNLALADEEAADFRKKAMAANQTTLQAAKVWADWGVQLIATPSSQLPPIPDLKLVIGYAFRAAINRFLASLGDKSPVESLAAIIALNEADLANRAPYGHGHLQAAHTSTLTAAAYAKQAAENQSVATNGLKQVFADYALDALLTDRQFYAAAGFPALSIPAGYNAEGQPIGVTLIGNFLGEPQLLRLGYAYEQATLARREPDLARTLAQIGMATSSDPKL